MKEKITFDIEEWIKAGKDMNFIKTSKNKNHKGSCDEAHPNMSHEDWGEKHDDCGCGGKHGKCTCDKEKCTCKKEKAI